MASIQAAPAQTYPVGESIVPPKATQQHFASRVVNTGEVSFDVTAFTDPNTAVDFFLEMQQSSDSSWILIDSSTEVGAPGGPQTRNGPIGTLTFAQEWDAGFTVKGARLRIDVRDAVPGSGLAQPVSLGAITLTWS